MKKFALALLLMFGALSVQSQRAEANGATVVFVQFGDYLITSAVLDKQFNKSKLYNVLESSADSLYVARLTTSVYRWATYYALRGDDVELQFDGYNNVVFRYYSSLRAIIGVTSTGEYIVLLPTTEDIKQPTSGDVKEKPVKTDSCTDEDN